MGGRSYPSHVNQVSIWHRDITLVTPRQLKAGQKYSQYQRQAAEAGQAWLWFFFNSQSRFGPIFKDSSFSGRILVKVNATVSNYQS